MAKKSDWDERNVQRTPEEIKAAFDKWKRDPAYSLSKDVIGFGLHHDELRKLELDQYHRWETGVETHPDIIHQQQLQQLNRDWQSAPQFDPKNGQTPEQHQAVLKEFISKIEKKYSGDATHPGVKIEAVLRAREVVKDTWDSPKETPKWGNSFLQQGTKMPSEYSRGSTGVHYPQGVLVNNFGITDNRTLHQVERQISALAAAEIQRNPIKGNYDREHLKAIHAKMFGGVYPWAGQERTHTLFKRRPDGMQTEFTRPWAFSDAGQKLKARVDDFLKSTDGKKDAEKLAGVYQQLNEMHTFAEGNGRVHRTFLESLASEKGKTLNFTKVEKEAWNYAASTGAHIAGPQGERYPGRTDELSKVFGHILESRQKGNPYSAGRDQTTAGKAAPASVMTLNDLNPSLKPAKSYARGL